MQRKRPVTVTIDSENYKRLRQWQEDNYAGGFSHLLDTLAQVFIDDRDIALKAAGRMCPWKRPAEFRWEALAGENPVVPALENAETRTVGDKESPTDLKTQGAHVFGDHI